MRFDLDDLFPIIVFILVVGFMALLAFTVVNELKDKQACRAKGGVVLEGQCYDAASLKGVAF